MPTTWLHILSPLRDWRTRQRGGAHKCGCTKRADGAVEARASRSGSASVSSCGSGISQSGKGIGLRDSWVLPTHGGRILRPQPAPRAAVARGSSMGLGHPRALRWSRRRGAWVAQFFLEKCIGGGFERGCVHINNTEPGGHSNTAGAGRGRLRVGLNTILIRDVFSVRLIPKPTLVERRILLWSTHLLAEDLVPLAMQR